MDMKTPIWVLVYLIDSDAWWPLEAPHNPNYFPDVHTYSFKSEKEARNHLSNMSDPPSYRIRKTYLQESI